MTYASAVRVRITAEHIACAATCDPILAAVRDAVGIAEVDVDRETATVGSGMTVVVFDLPPHAQRWVRWLDEGRTVEPYDFDLHLPEWLMTACRAGGGSGPMKPNDYGPEIVARRGLD